MFDFPIIDVSNMKEDNVKLHWTMADFAISSVNSQPCLYFFNIVRKGSGLIKYKVILQRFELLKRHFDEKPFDYEEVELTAPIIGI